MSSERRTYTKKARAEAEEATRLRITESAVALHGTLGPSRTTMSALAEHAGVTRSTLYRHFHDEAAVFDACSRHWAVANPPPDPSPWPAIADPTERTRTALGELYPYFRRNEQMLANLLRDEDTVAVVRDRFAVFHALLGAIEEILIAGRGLRGGARRRTAVAIGHALAFSTWQSLAHRGLSDAEAADLMTVLIDSAR
jgi:AcrR family transcriptional regulator